MPASLPDRKPIFRDLQRFLVKVVNGGILDDLGAPVDVNRLRPDFVNPVLTQMNRSLSCPAPVDSVAAHRHSSGCGGDLKQNDSAVRCGQIVYFADCSSRLILHTVFQPFFLVVCPQSIGSDNGASLVVDAENKPRSAFVAKIRLV